MPRYFGAHICRFVFFYAILILYWLPACAVAADTTRFPDGANAAIAPNQALRLYSVDHEDAEPNHTLLLTVSATQATEKVLDFDRYVEVAWSPNSQAFFVTDYAGSDQANCFVFKFPPLSRMDVTPRLLQLSPEKNLFKNHHLYIKCTRWKDARHVEVDVSGYGDQHPRGFKRHYILEIAP